MSTPIERRASTGDFLQSVLAGVLAVIAVTVLVVFLAYSWPAKTGTEVGIRLAMRLDNLREGEALKFEAPVGARFAVTRSRYVRDGTAQAGWLVRHDGKLLVVAVNAHRGCSINFVAAQAVFIDPCTGSRFGLDGRSLGDAGEASLARLAWRTISPDTIAVASVGR